MRGGWRARAAEASIAAVLAGCGGTSTEQGEAAKPARQIATDAVAATKQLHSFRLGGTITESRGMTRVAGAIAGPGRIGFSEQRGPDVVQVIALGTVTYLKASRTYYSAQPNLTPAQVTRYADRWLKLPTASDPSFANDLARTTNLSVELRCWAMRDSGLRVAGTGSVGARAAVILASDGSAPGSAPGKVYVSTTGPAWPLRSVVTGPRKAGGSGACAEPTTPRTSDITISDFNEPVRLAAPAGALDLTR
jgi:hypothetical protein